MKPSQIWAKANLSMRCSTSTRTGPLWIGVDTSTGAALASHRWDIPAGYVDLAAEIRRDQAEMLASDIKNARAANKPSDHLCHAIPSISMHGPATDAKSDGQFGRVLDQSMVDVLQSIPSDDMSWITSPERIALHDSFARLDLDQIDQIAWAVHRTGLPITILPVAGKIHFSGILLGEASQ